MAPDSCKQLYANTQADRRGLRVKLRAHLFDRGRPSSRPLSGKFDLRVLIKNQNQPSAINSAGPFELSVTHIQLETGADALVSYGSGPT